MGERYSTEEGHSGKYGGLQGMAWQEVFSYGWRVRPPFRRTREESCMKENDARENLGKETGKKPGKKLEEMNLLDDFLFGSVVTYPEVGERFVRGLLKAIFGREFGHLSVTAQKVFYGADSDLHGARLDVYLEPGAEETEGRAAVYDIEPDRKDDAADKRALPRRVRFYHGKVAARNLSSGVSYDELKDVVIIMIMPYDPFGCNRMVYTVKNHCVEEPGMAYEDGASTLFLYTKGTEGIPSEALKQWLHYMEDTKYENAVSEELREIHRMVETVRKDSEVGGMRIRIVDELIKLSDENAKLTEENTRQSDEITKLSEEIKRLRKELNQRSTEESAPFTGSVNERGS